MDAAVGADYGRASDRREWDRCHVARSMKISLVNTALELPAAGTVV